MRLGIFALIKPVITSTEGRCVAKIKWIPIARAFFVPTVQSVLRFAYPLPSLNQQTHRQ